MRNYGLFSNIALACLIVAAIFAGGCNGTTTGLPAAITTPLSPTPSVASVATTIPLAAAGVFMLMPAVMHAGIIGDSGSFAVATNDAPAGTAITLTSYHRHPDVAPRAHHLNLTTILWVSHTYSNAVTFDEFPQTSYGIGDEATGCSFVQDTFDGTTGALLATQQPARVYGDVVDGIGVEFPNLPTALSVVPGHTYWWVLSASPYTGVLKC
jgi:hypothetical protein